MSSGLPDSLPFGIIFNVLAALVFVIYWGLTFIIIYHLIRFGIGVQPKRFAAVFFLGSVILSSIALILFTSVDIKIDPKLFLS